LGHCWDIVSTLIDLVSTLTDIGGTLADFVGTLADIVGTLVDIVGTLPGHWLTSGRQSHVTSKSINSAASSRRKYKLFSSQRHYFTILEPAYVRIRNKVLCAQFLHTSECKPLHLQT
jgi:hypothetical protein